MHPVKTVVTQTFNGLALMNEMVDTYFIFYYLNDSLSSYEIDDKLKQLLLSKLV